MSDDGTVEIYALCDPDTDEVRYIGKANNARKRLQSHIWNKSKSLPVCRWIRKLHREGKSPTLVVLETCDRAVWEERERAIIAEYRNRDGHPPLLNVAAGGVGVVTSPEVLEDRRVRLLRQRFATLSDGQLEDLASSATEWERGGRMTKGLQSALSRAACVAPQYFGRWAA